MHWRWSRVAAEATLAALTTGALWQLHNLGFSIPMLVVLLCGLVMIGEVQAQGEVYLARRGRFTRELTDDYRPDLCEAIARFSNDLQITQPQTTIDTERSGVPTLIDGFGNPTLVFPRRTMSKMPQAETEAVIAHELAHQACRHGDRDLLRWVALAICCGTVWATFAVTILDGDVRLLLTIIYAASFLLLSVDERLVIPVLIGTGFLYLLFQYPLAVARRADEFEADKVAAAQIGAMSMATALDQIKSLREERMSEISQSETAEHYAEPLFPVHPSIETRIDLLRDDQTESA